MSTSIITTISFICVPVQLMALKELQFCCKNAPLYWDTWATPMREKMFSLIFHLRKTIFLQCLSKLGPIHSSDFLERLEFHTSLSGSQLNKCMLVCSVDKLLNIATLWQSIQNHCVCLALLNIIDTTKKKGRRLFFTLFSASGSSERLINKNDKQGEWD